VFFLWEVRRVSNKWKTALTIAGLVPVVAAFHYYYIIQIWLQIGDVPVAHRYIYWIVTVPMLVAQFYMVLNTVVKAPVMIFWRLISGVIVMLLVGYLGEAGIVDAWPAFIVSLAGLCFVIYEIYAGEAGKLYQEYAPEKVKTAYNMMRLIVAFGWSIYPIGYFVGYLTASGPAESMKALNFTYNLGDLINKIGFGLIVWYLAVSDTEYGDSEQEA
jgi:bacteriorhodopsin